MAPPPKKHKPPRRTMELPASLRAELQSLGHLPAPGKGKLGRKDKRKAARESSKLNRAAHFAQKRKATDDEEPAPIVKKEAEERSKRRKVDPAPAQEELKAAPAPAVEPTKKKKTALEKLLDKQEGRGGGLDPERKKNVAETNEDKEIAWLEAKLGVRGAGPPGEKGKGKWQDEFADDGLDDLFDGIDEVEEGVFGDDKDYEALLRAGSADDLTDASDDDLLAGLGSDLGSEGDSDDEEEDSEGDSEDEEMAEFGVSDEEMLNPSDDDDHREMGEAGSEDSNEEGEFDSEGSLDEEDEELDSDEADLQDADEEEDVGASAAKAAKVAPVASTSAATGGRYIPPHLRAVEAAAVAAPAAPKEKKPDVPPEDPRLRRILMGHLNKLSSSNISVILAALDSVYSSNPRAIVNTTLTTILMDIIASRDNLGDQLLINYAALVGGLARNVGIELPAGVVAKAVSLFEEAREKALVGAENDEEGFEGRPGSKEAENIVGFLAELYNFGVVACLLIYDLVRLFIDAGLNELDVELLMKVVKRSGSQLRSDDPSSLKEIISLVKQKTASIDPKTMNSRTRFMLDALANLKNNKTANPSAGTSTIDHYSSLKKFLTSLTKKGRSAPEPLRLTLKDLKASETKGKWWLVGAAWAGDPLAEEETLKKKEATVGTGDKAMAKLARAQGMNTDIRKGVFVVLMTSEDYVDACERLLQLGLSEVQQREIARVLLQCAGNEKAYNPYYTLVAHRLASKSHGFQITLQYCLWDFLREMGEKKVGGEQMVANAEERGSSGNNKISERRVANLAKLYAWSVAKESLTLAILKPVPFARALPQTLSFLRAFFSAVFLSSQTSSPALVLLANSAQNKKDQQAVERIFVKALPFPNLVRGLAGLLEGEEGDKLDKGWGEREAKLIRFGRKVAKGTLGVGEIDMGEFR